MKNSQLQHLRALTRGFVRELEYIKDNKFPFDIGHFHRHLLVEISLNPGMGTNALADLLVSDKGNVSRGIKLLISKKYLKESLNKEDRRKRDLEITARGQAIVDEVNRYSNEKLKQAFKKLPKTHLEQAEKGLEVFIEALRSTREEQH